MDKQIELCSEQYIVQCSHERIHRLQCCHRVASFLLNPKQRFEYAL